MFTKYDVHMLASDSQMAPIRKFQADDGGYILKSLHPAGTPQHIYWTLRAPVKMGQWVVSGRVLYKTTLVDVDDMGDVIVAATDQDLWFTMRYGNVEALSGIYRIPPEFVQKFVDKQGNIKNIVIEINLSIKQR